MSTTATLNSHPDHQYVLDADDVRLIVTAIGWRMERGGASQLAATVLGLDHVAMFGQVLQRTANGILDRMGNVVAARSLYLYGDEADIPAADKRLALALADRLFTSRMAIDKRIESAGS